MNGETHDAWPRLGVFGTIRYCHLYCDAAGERLLTRGFLDVGRKARKKKARSALCFMTRMRFAKSQQISPERDNGEGSENRCPCRKEHPTHVEDQRLSEIHGQAPNSCRKCGTRCLVPPFRTLIGQTSSLRSCSNYYCSEAFDELLAACCCLRACHLASFAFSCVCCSGVST